jgi:hypothetical protein
MIAETDTLFTGLSGLLLFILVVWACVHFIGGRR